MRGLWRDEPGWVIAIALVILLVLAASLRGHASDSPRPAEDPYGYCQYPLC